MTNEIDITHKFYRQRVLCPPYNSLTGNSFHPSHCTDPYVLGSDAHIIVCELASVSSLCSVRLVQLHHRREQAAHIDMDGSRGVSLV